MLPDNPRGPCVLPARAKPPYAFRRLAALVFMGSEAGSVLYRQTALQDFDHV